MTRILHTLPALDGGGAEKIVYNYCIRMMKDFHFDFIVHTKNKGILEESLEKHGCMIHHVPPFHENKIDYLKQVNQIIRDGKYDIIHVSQGYKGVIILLLANKNRVPIRIAHSHMAYIPETNLQKIVRGFVTPITKFCATELFACGRDAATWMWGDKQFSAGKVYIMTNAIDIGNFSFSLNKRKELRKQLGLDDKFVIGNVARFSFQKNHEFLIEIFSEIRKKSEKAVLMLIGGGELEEQVKDLVKSKALTKSVIFMGLRDDVPDLLNAMDLFILPSRFEGLPVALVEVQSNGLPALVSDSVTREIKIAKNLYYLPLDSGVGDWVNFALDGNIVRSQNNFLNGDNCIYNIESSSQILKEYYFNLKSCSRSKIHWS